MMKVFDSPTIERKSILAGGAADLAPFVRSLSFSVMPYTGRAGGSSACTR